MDILEQQTMAMPVSGAGSGGYCPIPHFVDRCFPDDPDAIETCDAIRYARAMRQAAQEYPDAFGFAKGFNRDASAAAIDRVIKKPDFNTLICEEDGRIVGGISYARPYKGTLELGYLFRLKDAGCRAIGRLLLRDGIRMTQAKGDTCVVLSVLPRNLKAIALYESIGFQAEERMTEDPDVATVMELRGAENIQRAIRILTDQITEVHAVGAAERSLA